MLCKKLFIWNHVQHLQTHVPITVIRTLWHKYGTDMMFVLTGVWKSSCTCSVSLALYTTLSHFMHHYLKKSIGFPHSSFLSNKRSNANYSVCSATSTLSSAQSPKVGPSYHASVSQHPQIQISITRVQMELKLWHRWWLLVLWWSHHYTRTSRCS